MNKNPSYTPKKEYYSVYFYFYIPVVYYAVSFNITLILSSFLGLNIP